MEQTTKKQATHFGAGNIGRAFVGDFLNANDYFINFIDTNTNLINLLNSEASYQLKLLGKSPSERTISNYRAINSSDQAQTINAMLASALITISIGVNNLKFLVPLFNAFFVAKRATKTAREFIQNIVCVENGLNVTLQFRQMLQVPAELESTLGFVNAAVDRIVPTPEKAEGLNIAAEEFFELALNAQDWKGEPQLKGATFYADLTPIVERKWLMLNGTHAYIAWLGFGHYTYIHQFRDNQETYRLVADYLSNLGQQLIKKHHLDRAAMQAYSAKLIERFSNEALADSITRVGRNVKTKLGPQERIITPLVYAYSNQTAYTSFVRALLAGLALKDYQDAEYLALRQELATRGLRAVLQETCGLTDSLLLDIIEAQAKRLALTF